MAKPKSTGELSTSNLGTARPPGVIVRDELYTVGEAKARLGWTDSALRSAKRQGLRLLACGKRRYLSGEEIHRFLMSINSNT